MLTFATKNVALPVAGFAFREGLMPAAGAAAGKILETGALTVFDPSDEFELRDAGREIGVTLGNMYDARRTAPLSEAPTRDAAAPAVEQQAGLVRVENTVDVTRTGEEQGRPSDWAVLGVREGTTLEEMRAALRDKGKALHPDITNGGEQFKAVTAAFARLQEGQGASQGATPDTPRQLSGTTVAPMPRGDTEGSRAQESSWQNLENDRKSLEDNYNYPSYQKDGDNYDPEDAEDNTPSFDSRPKEKTEDPRSSVSPARPTRDNKIESAWEKERKARQRAASVAGDGVSANDILAEAGIDATDAEMRAAKNKIVRFKRATTTTPTGPKSRK